MSATRLFVPPVGEYGSKPSPDDYAALERSWISRQIADSALIRRVNSEEGKEIVGRRDYEDYAGLLFPYYWPGRPGVLAHRIRRDNPPYEIRNGHRKQRDKYMSAPGWGNTLYFHPLTPAASLSDVAVPCSLKGRRNVWLCSASPMRVRARQTNTCCSSPLD